MQEALKIIIDQKRTGISSVVINNWSTTTGGIGNYGRNYDARAAVAYGGWGANIVEDSAYSTTYFDVDGDRLDNKHSYKLHINADEFPHAAVFWSLTLYGEPSKYPVPNAIDRFAINSYDIIDGIVDKNEDGSLDIYISAEKPLDTAKSRNWLPAPSGEENFSLAIRIYWPDEFTLEGKWNPPVITKI